jgi:hypothetical protein
MEEQGLNAVFNSDTDVETDQVFYKRAGMQKK